MRAADGGQKYLMEKIWFPAQRCGRRGKRPDKTDRQQHDAGRSEKNRRTDIKSTPQTHRAKKHFFCRKPVLEGHGFRGWEKLRF